MLVLGIPTLNRFDLLRDCIASALASSVAPDHILVFDNSAGQCPRDYGEQVTYLTPAKQVALAAAWNSIAQIAFSRDAELIISNDDIVFAPDTIAQMLTVAASEPNAGIVSPIEGQRFALFYLRRAAYESVGLFDSQFYPAYFEDNDYHRRLTLNGWSSPVAPSAVIHHGSSTIKAFDLDKLHEHHPAFAANQRRYLIKWGGLPGHEVYDAPYNALVTA